MNLIKSNCGNNSQYNTETLNILHYDIKADMYELTFDCNFDKAIEIKFYGPVLHKNDKEYDTMKPKLYNLNDLVVGKYYFCCFLKYHKLYLLYRGISKNHLYGKLSTTLKNFNGRLCIKLAPNNEEYSSKSNCTGMFYYIGYSLDEIMLAGFNRFAYDKIHIGSQCETEDPIIESSCNSEINQNEIEKRGETSST